MDSVEEKRIREKELVSWMIHFYCKKKHKNSGYGKVQKRECSGSDLCPECQALDAYAKLRSDKCPFMETKTFCSNCKVHCYKPEMREKIREVMRFCGPRMMLYHPVLAIRHVIESKKEKRRLEEKS